MNAKTADKLVLFTQMRGLREGFLRVTIQVHIISGMLNLIIAYWRTQA